MSNTDRSYLKWSFDPVERILHNIFEDHIICTHTHLLGESFAIRSEITIPTTPMCFKIRFLPLICVFYPVWMPALEMINLCAHKLRLSQQLFLRIRKSIWVGTTRFIRELQMIVYFWFAMSYLYIRVLILCDLRVG